MRLVTWIPLLMTLTSCGSSDSSGSSSANDNGGKGGSPLTDGKYALVEAKATTSVVNTTYELLNSSLNFVLSSPNSSSYKIIYNGGVILRTAGTETPAGCDDSGRQESGFTLDANNKVALRTTGDTYGTCLPTTGSSTSVQVQSEQFTQDGDDIVRTVIATSSGIEVTSTFRYRKIAGTDVAATPGAGINYFHSYYERDGKYQTSCGYDSSLGYKKLSVIIESNITGTDSSKVTTYLATEYYSSAGCDESTRNNVALETYTSGTSNIRTTSSGILEMNLKTQDIQRKYIGATTVSSANSIAAYGITNWVSNSYRSVTSTKYQSSSSAAAASVGTMNYTIMKFDSSGNLQMGDPTTGDQTTSDKRPTAVSSVVFTKVSTGTASP
jgi:hypothetical protein